jgi:hypothetical protein
MTDDLEACLELDRDPQVTRFIAGPWLDPIAHRAFVEARMRHLYPAGMGYWSVIVSQSSSAGCYSPHLIFADQKSKSAGG